MNLSTVVKRTEWLAFAVPLAVYSLTLCPTVYWDDAGELIAAAYTLGIPHPPGHPLYAIVGRIFAFIPFGTIAARVNFMSAFFGALTCWLVFRIIVDRVDDKAWRPLAALGGALFFAFAPTVWDQATVAETSTFHSFFMMLLTLLAFRLTSGKVLWKNETCSLCLFSYLYGLSLTNHVAGVFFFPAFACLFIAKFGKRIFAPRLLLNMLFWFFTGLVVYAYLPIRSLANPPIDWGNPENLRNFLWVVTARQYAPNLAHRPSLLAIAANLVLRGKDLLHQFTIIGCAVGVVGLLSFLRKEKALAVYSLLVIAVLLYIGLNSAFISAYFIPGLALIAVWIGVGLRRILGWISRFAERIRPASAAMVMRQVLCGALAVSFVLPLGINFRDMDRSRDYHALCYGQELLAGLPEGSALFTVDGYALFILWYLKYCEHKRPDLMVIEPTWVMGNNALSSLIREQYPEFILPSSETVEKYKERSASPTVRQYLAIQAVLDANCQQRPVYWGVIARELPFFSHLTPQGPLYRYSAEPVQLDRETIARDCEFWESELRRSLLDASMRRDKVVQEIYPVELNNQGLMFEALNRDDLAEWAIELALKFNPEYPISRYNLARLESRAAHYEEAIREYRRAIEGNPYMAVAYYGLGNAYRNTHRYDEAFLAYRSATRLYPDYYEALTAMGQLYSLVGRYGDAAGKFEQALKIEPGYPFALRGLASAYLEMNRLDDAKEVLDKALQTEPGSAAGLFMLAKYYFRSGSNERAADVLKRSFEIGGTAFVEEARADKDLKTLADAVKANGGRE